MSLYTVQPTDLLPHLHSPEGLYMEECTDLELLAFMGSTTVEDVAHRMANDHVAYMAYYNSVPAAFGWMARGKARIGELAHEIILPVGNRYLWNFRTLEAFRGLGIYPALLHYIIRNEKEKATRFWIIHAPENKASLKGIVKAGFHYVGTLYSKNGMALIGAAQASVETRDLLHEMDIAFSEEQPASCWNCSSPFLKKRKPECCCAASQTECTVNYLSSLLPVKSHTWLHQFMYSN